MRRQKQTILANDGSGRQGNCLQAAVATLLDLDMDDVPHFAESDRWLEWIGKFAAYHGYDVSLEDTGKPPRFGLAFGPSHRGLTHAVVYENRRMAWDPHPDGTGLVSVTVYVHFRVLPKSEDVKA